MHSSLLGSLYGNLPAPKSGPPIPFDTIKGNEGAKTSAAAGDSSCLSSETNGSAGAASAPPGVLPKMLSTAVPRNLLLMAPPPRKRDTGQRRVRPQTASGVSSMAKAAKEHCPGGSGSSVVATAASVLVSSSPTTVVVADTTVSCSVIASSAVTGLLPSAATESVSPHGIATPASCDESPSYPIESNICTLPRKLINEYDPAKPNSYDEYVKERARYHRKREEERRQKEELERLREEQQRRAASAVPTSMSASLSISGDEAWKRRGQLSAAIFGEPPAAGGSDTPAQASGTTEKGRGFAQKMLEKMGWKHGEGLGREKQGILAPLVARKTDKHSGVIVQGNTPVPPGTPAATPAAVLPSPSSLPATDVSRIVLLTNLVGKGEVDSDLESETAEEAAKFGNLLAVKIVEVSTLPDEEGVRIFCEYESSTAAVKAVQSFHGRLFGGRSVKAQFFSEKLYAENNLMGD